MITEQDIKLQQEWLKKNKIKKYTSKGEVVRPYTGTPQRQTKYRKDKSLLSRLFQSQDFAVRDYGGGSTQSAGQGD